MRDDFYSKDWADNRQQLGNAVHKLVRSLADAYRWLNAYQFDAPWRHTRDRILP